jgi:quinol monooxygenase YgiN
MYGLIGRIRAVSGKRADLAAILIQEDGSMPGCLSYIVAEDPADADLLWVTEVWTPTAPRCSYPLCKPPSQRVVH